MKARWSPSWTNILSISVDAGLDRCVSCVVAEWRSLGSSCALRLMALARPGFAAAGRGGSPSGSGNEVSCLPGSLPWGKRQKWKPIHMSSAIYAFGLPISTTFCPKVIFHCFLSTNIVNISKYFYILSLFTSGCVLD